MHVYLSIRVPYTTCAGERIKRPGTACRSWITSQQVGLGLRWQRDQLGIVRAKVTSTGLGQGLDRQLGVGASSHVGQSQPRTLPAAWTRSSGSRREQNDCTLCVCVRVNRVRAQEAAGLAGVAPPVGKQSRSSPHQFCAFSLPVCRVRRTICVTAGFWPSAGWPGPRGRALAPGGPAGTIQQRGYPAPGGV